MYLPYAVRRTLPNESHFDLSGATHPPRNTNELIYAVRNTK